MEIVTIAKHKTQFDIIRMALNFIIIIAHKDSGFLYSLANIPALFALSLNPHLI